MKKLARHIVSAARSTLVAMMITALMVSIVSSAQRHTLLDEQIIEQNSDRYHAQLIQGPPNPADIAKSMTPGQRPYTEQSAHTLQSVSTSKNGGDDHFRLTNSQTTAFVAFRSAQRNSRTTLTSTALISSQLSNRFTLVGARPDGTS